MTSLPVRALRIGTAWAVSLSLWAPALLVFALLPRRVEDRVVYRFSRWWGRLALAILGVSLEEVNPTTLDGVAPRVVVINHQSALDLLWGAAILPPRPMAIGKKEVVWVPGVNLVWWVLRFVRVDRSRPRRAIAALQGMAETLAAEERSLMVAPEGTRTLDGELLPFKKGPFHIAIDAGAPVYPVVVCGAFELMPKREWFPYPGALRVRYLEPIPTAGLGKEDVGALAERVRKRMAAAYDHLREGDA